MATKNITYKEYKKLLNLIAYQLDKSGKKYNHRDKYTAGGKTVSYKKIISKIKENGKDYTSNRYIARFIEKTIIKDNKNLDFLPSSVKIDDEKYTKNNYVDAIQRVVKYRKNNKQNPKNIKITYTTIPKKYGRSTKNGCDNRGQNNGYFCGPHMVQEIIRNLTGKVIPQHTLASVIGTTTSGSCHEGINTSFAWFNNKYNYNLKVEWKNFSDVGWSGIKKILESNNQDIGLHELYRNTWGHYTNFDKVYDNTVDVHNSLGSSCSDGCYCGYTENRTKTEAKSYLNGISQKSVLVVTRE